MKMNKMFYVTVTLVVMLFIATGCQKQDYDNSIFKVSDEFLNGYGKDVRNVYVMNDEGLFVAGDATDSSVYRDRGIGLDLTEGYGATGVYTPIAVMNGHKTSACLSYGDIAPVVLNKKKDSLYSERDFSITLRPAEFVKKIDYVDAMKEYNQVCDDDYEIFSDCRWYKISEESIKVVPLESTSDGGVIYDIKGLKSGLYFIDDTQGIIEVR